MAAGASRGDFGITKFMAKVDALGGVARKNRFSVEIIPPTTLVTEIDASAINFLAKSVSFPAKTFGTTTYRSTGKFGLDVPYEVTFEPVTITMVNTNDHSPRIFWDNWFEHIQSMNSYNMQYYKKFIGTVKISHYSEDAFFADPVQANHRVTLHEAWPKTMSAIEMGWEDSELGSFTIDIAYSWWTQE